MVKYIVIGFICMGMFGTQTYGASYTVKSRSEIPQDATMRTPIYYEKGGDNWTIVSSSSSSSSSDRLYGSSIDNGTSILGVDDTKIRRGDFSFDDIPGIITYIIEFLLGVAGSVSIVVIIWGALQMQLNSGIFGKSDDKGRKLIIGGIVGFLISLSSWFIVSKLVEILVDTTL